MMTIVRWIRWLRGDQRGQGMTEYALVLGVITLALVAALRVVGEQVEEFFDALVALFP